MNKSITQDNQNDNHISKSIRNFFTRFRLSSALKAANACKKKGFPASVIFQYLFMLIFSNRSMYMNLLTGRNTPNFAKDTVYRFMKMTQINWMHFTTLFASRIMKEAIIAKELDCEWIKYEWDYVFKGRMFAWYFCIRNRVWLSCICKVIYLMRF